ncbi:MAG: excinuclease ABC subunit UvrA [Betaproteobacteria bacterium]|nr:excinuclease ABC subunit UvrA [Betaproteobacteria bacterium]
MPNHPQGAIVVRGARQNNLKNLDLDIPLNELTVVTGVSGSGKSSLVFDTLYAEGQRRYVETFSPYARQFLERMDKPQVDAILGIPPAIAIDQTNPVRTSRSTVGTMTELNDHLKLLFARAAQLYCRGCGKPVRRDTPQSIFADLAERAKAADDPRLVITFPVPVPKNFSEQEVRRLLEAQGYTRVHGEGGNVLRVVQDRLRLGTAGRARVMEALEAALRVGQGRVNVHVVEAAEAGNGTVRPELVEGRLADEVAAALRPGSGRTGAVVWKFSSDLHCADCDIHYPEPNPSLFSFNSPIGACETCRGFGRSIGIDYGLVIPDESKTLKDGAVKPWQTESYRECQAEMMSFAKKRGIRVDVPWRELTPKEKQWVLEGEGHWEDKLWYGVDRFFAWLETKAYKMHIRVLLSRYRAYTPCRTCDGARLKTDALLYRLGAKADADGALPPANRFLPKGVSWSGEVLAAHPGLAIHDLMLLPIDRCRDFFAGLHLPAPLDEATDLLLTEIRTRLGYLNEVGLGYLTLDRQSRTLSGGEVQRINLTTALGTSLVNTLFVLDEPSIGLHPRDMGRVIGVMQRLRDAGNSLLVVEHDPQIMLQADRILDLGPGPGEKGGQVVCFGTPAELRHAKGSLTGDYLAGRKRVDASAGAASAEAAARNGKSLDSGVRRNDDTKGGPRITILGAAEHNLKGIDVELPLNRLVCVTGVSGSGKSTLIQDVLYAALRKLKGKPTEVPGAHREVAGHQHIAEAVMVDQSPIGRTTRSNPASYVGAFEAIRNLFAREPASLERGYTRGTFSFNSGNGRCPACGGNGFEHVEMQFLSDVYLRCPDCDGKRYRPEVLEVKLAINGRGRSIAEVLEMTVSEAIVFFGEHAPVLAALQPLADVGLEYLRLGQPVPTLSGGEAQRLKLAGHLADAAQSSFRRKVVTPECLNPGPESRKLMADWTPASAGATNLDGLSQTGKKGTLFLFDEPTTGLHFDDTAKLLRALRQLIAAGHSAVVIEHNLDVIAASDWIVDLGPEGGDAGGEVVCVGTPEEVKRNANSHTGRALAEYEAAASASRSSAAGGPAQGGREGAADNAIRIHNAREHNLKNVDIALPRDCFTVVTGVSGSGKSTLAFDIVFAEGQRRYLESLNAYARQFVQPTSRPDVDAIWGIPPTVAIEQRTSRGGRKSTVATLTEIYHFLRLLYVKLGIQHCPECDVAIQPRSFDAIAARLLREYRGQHIGLLAPLVVSRKGYYTDLAKWAAARGFTHLRVDGEFLVTAKWPRLDRFREHTLELPVADVRVSPSAEQPLRDALSRALDHGKGVVHVLSPLERLMEGGKMSLQAFSTRRACPSCGRSFPEPDPRLFSFNSKHGWCEACYGTGQELPGFDEVQSGEEIWWNEWWEGEDHACSACEGKRLNPTALAVRFRGRSIADLAALPVAEMEKFFRGLKLQGRDAEIARDILAEISSRLGFLNEVGLSYLSLDRSAPTLSGGEAQRIRLAAQLGSNLRGVCYILDEPTIGLHPRDNRILLDTLQKLESKGNTLLVVEHDEDTIRRAAHVVDLGPGAGTEGGHVVAEGTATELMKVPESVTGRFLASPLRHPLVGRRRTDSRSPALVIERARLNNLKNLRARIPLGRLVCVTGVSGSGKSTLARDVLYANLQRFVAQARRRREAPLIGCKGIRGWDAIGRVLEVDQTPIGKTPRSCPATYVGFWDAVRRLFADTTEARMRGYTPSRFSFNTPGGRCDACDGQGLKKIEMSFLPDVKVTCEACGGARFNPETLSVQFKGRTVGHVLAMSVDEATEFFSAHASIHHALKLLHDVGLGYLTLGQQSPTLSGGEAQRIKLVTELAKVRDMTLPPPSRGRCAGARSRGPACGDATAEAHISPPAPALASRFGVASTASGRGTCSDLRGRGAGGKPHTLYVLDEPTVGLHMADVEKLIRVLHRLVDAGNTVVVIEHNLDMIADADWIVDLGPEGGDAGGRIAAEGTPEEVSRVKSGSYTAEILARFLAERAVVSAAPGTVAPANGIRRLRRLE